MDSPPRKVLAKAVAASVGLNVAGGSVEPAVGTPPIEHYQFLRADWDAYAAPGSSVASIRMTSVWFSAVNLSQSVIPPVTRL